MDTVYYYRDRYYGTWHTVRAGRDSQRTDWDAEPTNPNFVRINPPRDSNPNWWWTGEGWRKEPHRGFSIDREGIHAVYGGLVGALPWATGIVALVAGASLLVVFLAVLTGAVISYSFDQVFTFYEDTEDDDLADRAYRDVAGYQVGKKFMTLTGIATLAALLIGQGG